VSVLVLILCLSISEADPEAIWTMANQAYAEGRYNEAIVGYEALIEEGVYNGKLHFNLGNAYAKQDRIGLAMLHYLKARKYLPGDPDIAANLELVEQRRPEMIEGEDEAFMASYDALARRLSYPLVFYSAAFCLLLAGSATAWRLFRPEIGKWLTYVLVISLVWGLIASSVAVLQYQQRMRDDLGVLIAKTTDVRAGPAQTETISF